MHKKTLELLTIPPAIRLEFWQDTLQKNRISLLVISVMIFGMELFNIARVLFWSASGLRSANNRIYFTMYCALLLGAALYLLLQYRLQKASHHMQWAVQAGAVAFFLLWHVSLNAYDLSRNPAAGTYTFITAIAGLAMFIQMPAAFGAAYFGLGYALFMLLSAAALDMGTVINLTMTTIVALAISFTRCRHAVIELSQRRKISQINTQLQQLLQKDPLTGLLNKKATENCISCALASVTQADPLAMFMMDLDDFKSINDRYGHPCGDHVLMETARKLRLVFPDAMCVGRIGGDEFAVLLHCAADGKALKRQGHQFIQALSEIRWLEQRLDVSCSVGILRIGLPGVGYERLYAETDRVLYDAKRCGKGCCRFREFII
ncbi:MAG: GGDEF domain-containing protein [Oscillospiraceae bacterium]|nr:GGDEF domain-containing protein [Oscillospiraceae bacterium]